MSKMRFEEGDHVTILEEADCGTGYDHVREIGFITQITYKPRNEDDCFPPPYLVEFEGHELQEYWGYEMEKFP